MNSKRNVTAVLFDWAGTVVDHGSWAPVIAFLDVFHEKGVDLELDEVRRPMGMSKREHIQELVTLPRVRSIWQNVHGRDVNNTDVDDLYWEFLKEQENAINGCSGLISGTTEAVSKLVADNIRIGSTSGYPFELMRDLVSRTKENGFSPDCIITATDVQAGRPAPWMIYRACECLDSYPMSQVVNVDDTVTGVQAGRNAGCWSVGVSRTGNLVGLSESEWKSLSPDRQDMLLRHASCELFKAGAHFVVESVADIPCLCEGINRVLDSGMCPETFVPEGG